MKPASLSVEKQKRLGSTISVMMMSEEQRTNLDQTLIIDDDEQVADDEEQHPELSLQRVTHDHAVAPLLRKPIAPFDRTERKRAHTSALFYSECFLHGIEPKLADTAAVEAQDVYNKWWVKNTAASPRVRINNNTEDDESSSAINNQTGEGAAKKSKPCSKLNTTAKNVIEHTTGNRRDLASSDAVGIVSISNEDYKYDDISSKNGSAQSIISSTDGCLFTGPPLITNFPLPSTAKVNIEMVKMRLIEDLRLSGGCVDTPEFLKCQQLLENHFNQNGLKDLNLNELEGNWLTISKPAYTECKGKNEKGENRYSLGRISFDMFKPADLTCSFQASFNHIQSIDPSNPGRPLHVPRSLMQDIRKGECRLQTYDIAVAVTIEPGQDLKGNSRDKSDTDCYVVPKPIRGILTTQGYSIPDPNIPNRLSIWFSGGSFEVQDEEMDIDEWKKIFDQSSAPNRDLQEYANSLAARLLLGAHIHEKLEEDGTLRFDLKRPIGGHGSVFCDIIYTDDTLRIMHGHHDSVYVCVRVPDSEQ